jgi:hypothetical protein
MKKGIIVGIAIIILLFSVFLFNGLKGTTGKIAGSEFVGIPEEEQKCMQNCVAIGCESNDIICMTGNKDKCMVECGAKPSPLNEDELCVQNCIDKYCEEGPNYANCMNEKIPQCDEECGMTADEPDVSEMGEEEKCIFECVNAIDPTLICGNSQEGETGNEVCQQCANSCVHLYEGPCLNDKQIEEKEKSCETCEHCYGEPVEGPSGEGWDCIINIECKDASLEFGDEPGIGHGIEKLGEVNGQLKDEQNVVSNIIEGVGNFFKNIFS